MSGEKIEVNKEVLSNEIINLKKLEMEILNNKVKDIEVLGKGYTKEYMVLVNEGFKGIINTIKDLISKTVNVVENIEDGYIEADESSSIKFSDFTKEVLGNE